MKLLLCMALALSVTLILELAFALAWGLRRKQLWIVVLMNLLTNPVANALYSFMTACLGWQPLLPVIILEAAVITAEGLCCRDFMKKPWAFVIACNAFSYSMGHLLQKII